MIMAASLASEETFLENVAFEPEICDLLKLLRVIGVEMMRCCQNLHIQGCDSLLSGVEHVLISDRIECMSYAYAAAATRGKVHLIGKNLVSQLPCYERLEYYVDGNGCDVISIDDVDHRWCKLRAGR